MATLKDVARETELTVSTVSRVLNNRGYISEETRNKVYAAMKKLNYQPNELARSLSKRTTNTLGVIVPHLDHPYFSKLISNLEAAAYEYHYKLLLFNSRDKNEKETEYLEMCKSNRVAGIILCSGTVGTEEFEEINVPLITIERNLEHGTATVECDNKQGGRIAAAHLAECGCRNVIYMSGLKDMSMPADQRAEGFAEVCKKKGIQNTEIKTDSKLYATLDYREYIEQVLLDHPQTDGIFASSDVIAAQVIQVCKRRGIDIPKQLKLIGFDDVNIASLTTPSITTIKQPIREMAYMAISLIASSNNNQIVPSRTTLPVTLVKRETT
ncbi:LacI family DNA-binding transcriptional regulator [Anaerocolumna sp. MB42-C2]|uniref:LacI family DNA-binding transcriptional regulator n=1 Tax=Anaerocolumna sp. MB42-C2 TaxID=3070997 RepID=UPI0027E1A97D|nr:LacI family DNA-binding transcriptional regulator [Anaerocolumna sp. MB42-C2]WMJ85876.1 LacI family DNA-binding transcriptional regulator [Anaerocolumna sp. MB42-C2]